ncbi:MAG: bile acid:sodium symporter family protein [Phycisphaerae bacterium]
MFEKILRFYTKFFALWVVIFGIAAFVWSDIFIRAEKTATWFFAVSIERFLPEIFRLEKAMNWFFALTMFGIGAVLESRDFKRIVHRPAMVLIGSTAQFIIMPFGAFLLAKAFNLSPVITVGLILTGSAPGAMASNVMCYIAKADTAYSVSLTTVSTLLCPILTPTLTWLLARSKIDVPFVNMMTDIIMMVIVPLFAGFAFRHYFRKQAEKILPIFPAISVTFIIFICSMVIAFNRGRFFELSGLVLIAVVILNLYGMISGYSVGRLFKMPVSAKRTLAIEIGMQNAGLGTTLALSHFGEQAALPAAAFVFICIITASILAEIWQKTAQQEI